MKLKIRRSGIEPSRVYFRLRFKSHDGSFDFRLTLSEFFQHALFGFVIHHRVSHRQVRYPSLVLMA
jgi:hypothetical protein